MSVQAIGWVLDHSSTTGTDRLVLLSIANHAGSTAFGEAFEAYPGIELIMHETRIARRRTVTDTITRLIDGGHLERIVNGAPDQRIPAHRRPNLYRIRIADGVRLADTPPAPDGVSADDARGAGLASDGVSDDDAMGCAQATPKPSVNRQEPSVEPNDARGATVIAFDPDADNPEGDAFARFWSVYPRNHGKGAARKAWPKAVRVSGDAERIIAGASRFATDPNRDDSYTPHASTWLNGERWDDPPLPPRQRRGGSPPRRPAAVRRTGTAEVDRW